MMNRLLRLEVFFKLIALQVKIKLGKRTRLDSRYRTDIIDSKHLQGNKMGCPSRRELRVYLPPGYFESDETRYPMIYVLHGNNAGEGSWPFTSKHELDKSGSKMMYLLPRKFTKMTDFGRLVLFYEQFDALIRRGEIPPVIIVQPDASLGNFTINGARSNRGSMYVNSRASGNFPMYILDDVISHVDGTYRTIAAREGRAIAGGSMGGYGALSLAIQAPDKFIATAATCPLEFDTDFNERKVISPLETFLYGEFVAEKHGKNSTRELVKSIVELIGEDWEEYMIRTLLKKNPDSLKKMSVYLFCEKNDEFGLYRTTKEIHDLMDTLDIRHEFVTGSDPRNMLSPHTLGSLSQVLAVLRYCTSKFKY